ncbi:uncharacterized protein LOC105429745 [Pogonomyrmex barbatus]|uniref:Uncharacterized protein LOC105429745 n=1 Tax=Pogonomyrmex barbatus TaxID=144034 RepID=A0A6I9X992_9HYME|nr:uncharacterized protein LOC105429745 [Pogonomyrmex barbatus]
MGDPGERTVSDERLNAYLRTYVKITGLTDPKFRVIEATNKGDNYVSLVYRVAIEGTENQGEAKKIDLILKTTRTYSDEVLTNSSVTRMFQREMFFYQEILPIFERTMREHGEVLERFPALCDAYDESGKEMLMLENLAPQGFVMAKSKIMDYPHASLALRCLGEFHACSFITRSADPTSFEKLRRMKEHVFLKETNANEISNAVTSIRHIVVNVIKALAIEDKHYSERYQRFAENMRENMIDSVDGSAAEPYAVVNHGDAWTNNMLFKYDKENNPCDLRFIDLQLCRYASPVLDILYILFCCCTQEMRSKYYDQLIHEYYETLSKCLERAGYDPNVLFPHEALSEHFTRFGKYAAGMATYTLHIFTSDGVEIKNTYEKKMLEDRLQNDSRYRNMLIGTFKDLVDKNYI